MKPRADCYVLVPLLVSAIFFVSCSNPEGDFKKAEQANTEQAYSDFIQRHPKNPLAEQANAKMATLLLPKLTDKTSVADYETFIKRFSGTEPGKRAQERLAQLEFNRATNENTMDGYKRFLSKHSQSEWTDQAKQRLEGQLEEREFSQLLLINTVEAYIGFLSNHAGTAKRASIYEAIVKVLSSEGWKTERQNYSLSTPKGWNMVSERDGTISYYPEGTTFTCKIEGSFKGEPLETTWSGTLSRVVGTTPIFTNGNGNVFVGGALEPVPCLASDYIPMKLSEASDRKAAFQEFCRLSGYVAVAESLKNSKEGILKGSSGQQSQICKIAPSLQHPDGLVLLKGLQASGSDIVRSNATAALVRWTEIHDYVERLGRRSP